MRNTVELPVLVRGAGIDLLLIHGAAADHTTWSLQLGALASRFHVIAYDRRGTDTAPLPEGITDYSVGAHAADAAEVLEHHASAPAIVCGSSFGAVVALELLRTRSELVRGAVLCEPPLGRGQTPPVPSQFLDALERRRRELGDAAAVELFLQTVLGSDGFARLPRLALRRCVQLADAICADARALASYTPRYAELEGVSTPTLLLAGERSAAFYRPALETLNEVLGRSRLIVLPGAGHMLHVDAHRALHAELIGFATELSEQSRSPS